MTRWGATLVLLSGLTGCISPVPRGPAVRPSPPPGGDATPTARYGPPISPYNPVAYMTPPRPLAGQPTLTVGQPPPPLPREWAQAPQLTPASSPNLTAPRAAPQTQAAAWQTIEPPVAPVPPPAPEATPVAVLGSRKIPFHFTVEKADPSATPEMELWWSYAGGPWEKHPQPVPPAPPFIVEVSEDGEYGFILVAREPGAKPPAPGEEPQLRVEVDTTAPDVRLLDVKAPAEGEVKSVRVYWQAADSGLADAPVTLLWARDVNGPWLPIVSGLENTGGYEWKLPPGLPPQFFVRVEAIDRGNNIGAADTPGPVVLNAAAMPHAETLRSVVGTSSSPRAGVVAVETESAPAARPSVTFDEDR